MNINLSEINPDYISKLNIIDLKKFLQSSEDYVLTDPNADSQNGFSGIVIKSDKYNAFKVGEIVYFDFGASKYLSETYRVGSEGINVRYIHYRFVRHTDKPIPVEKNKKSPNKNVAGKERLPKNLYSAVSFALSLMKKGNERKRAIKIASNYYKESYEDVQSGVAKIATSKRKNIEKKQSQELSKDDIARIQTNDDPTKEEKSVDDVEVTCDDMFDFMFGNKIDPTIEKKLKSSDNIIVDDPWDWI